MMLLNIKETLYVCVHIRSSTQISYIWI